MEKKTPFNDQPRLIKRRSKEKCKERKEKNVEYNVDCICFVFYRQQSQLIRFEEPRLGANIVYGK